MLYRNISLYKPSQFNIILPLQDGALAYSGMGGVCKRWTALQKEIYDLLARGGSREEAERIAPSRFYLSKFLDELLQEMFILKKANDELKLFTQAIAILKNKKEKALSLTIAPTMACNFACDYCFQGLHDAGKPMGAKVQEDILNFIRENISSKQSVNITWYGGEPLLAVPVIESLTGKMLALCRENGCVYSASIVTNGFMLTPAIAERLVNCKITSVQVTLDGDAQAHDSRRYLKGGGATFAVIVENLRQVVPQDNLHFNIRVNIDQRNKNRIEDLLFYLSERGFGGRENFNVYFAPVDIGIGTAGLNADEVMTLENFSALELELLKKAVALKLHTPGLPIRLGSLCGAVRKNSFVILPDGSVHKCWNTVSDAGLSVGNIGDYQKIYENGLYQNWLARPLLKYKECYDCIALPQCAGGCADKTGAYGASCRSLKNNLREQLKLYAINKDMAQAEKFVQPCPVYKYF